ncbi:MAG: hypothetical protein D6731_06985 [Planctomycetota bacterium]|nr:MAG: hypothetical protein D6731_06985 [Planctomycetota bacterium]
MTRRPVLCALLLFSCTGCGLFSDSIEPKYEIDEDAWVAVMPFQDPDFPTSRWSSPRGHDLALKTTQFLERFAEFNTVDYGKVLELMYLPPREPKEGEEAPASSDAIGLDVDSLSEKKFADICGADYVVVCKILHYQLRDPKNINMTQASATAECKLFRVAVTRAQEKAADELTARERRMREARRAAGLPDGGPVAVGGKWVDRQVVTVKWPDDYLNSYAGDIFLDPQVVEEKLKERLARAVSRLYYEYEPEEYGSGS